MPKPALFQPNKVLDTLCNSELITERTIEVNDSLKQYEKDFRFCFVNTMHMYLRIPVSLFKLYTQEFNRKMTVVNFVLPKALLTENVVFPPDTIPPKPGWSRYVQGIPHEQYKPFMDWLVNTKMLARDVSNAKILFECCVETATIRDPVKLQQMREVGLKEFVDIDFYLPASLGSRLYLNSKNGPPFTCIYTARSSPGTGDLTEIFNKLNAE